MLASLLALAAPQLFGPEDAQSLGTIFHVATVATDFDQDGDVDFLWTAFGGGNVGWAPNGGSGYAEGIRLISGDSLEAYRPSSIAAIDADLDGDLDVVYTADSLPVTGVKWLENRGPMQFAAPADLPGTPSSALSLARFDADGDGDDDLLIANDGQGIAWMEAVPGVGLVPPVPLVAVSAGVFGIQGADFDGDGAVDLVWRESGAPTIAWARGIGSGSFGPRQALASGGTFDVADLEGDGDLDVVVARLGTPALDFHLNDGTGAFTPSLNGLTTSGLVRELRLADLDSDGDADLCALTSADRFDVHLNVTGLSFGPADATGIAPLGVDEGSVGADDLDGDGDLDPWFAGAGLEWRANDGSGTLGPARSILEAPEFWTAGRAGDIDGDGIQEFVTSTNMALLVGERFAAGGTVWTSIPTSAVPETAPLVADLDADGDEDVVLGLGRLFSPPGEVVWFENDGSLLAPVSITGAGIGYFLRPILGEANGDGLPDVLIEWTGPTGGAFRRAWWLQGPGGGFTQAPDIAEPNWWPLDTGDIDHDGLDDVLLAKNRPAINGLEFAYALTLPGGAAAPSVSLGQFPIYFNSYDLAEFADVNGDGELDVCICDPAQGLLIALGQGGGVIAQPTLAAPVSALADKELAMGDVDGDGDVDALLRAGASLVLCANDGTGTFAAGVALASSFGDMGTYRQMTLTDVDGDHDDDVVRYADSRIVVHRALSRLGRGYCQAEAVGSNGLRPRVFAEGSAAVVQNTFVLGAERLPAFAFGLFVVSPNRDHVPAAGGIGTLCLGTGVGRFDRPGEIRQADPAGAVQLAVDLTDVPTPFGPAAIAPGETRFFQYWTRDTVGGAATSNFTDALQVDFR